MGLVDRVTGRMRRADRVGRTITLRLRFDDLTRVTRSHTLPDATSATAVDGAPAASASTLPPPATSVPSMSV